jgi:hypothetical protein
MAFAWWEVVAGAALYRWRTEEERKSAATRRRTDGRLREAGWFFPVCKLAFAGEIFSRNIQGVCKWATMAPTVYAFYYYVL